MNRLYEALETCNALPGPMVHMAPLKKFEATQLKQMVTDKKLPPQLFSSFVRWQNMAWADPDAELSKNRFYMTPLTDGTRRYPAVVLSEAMVQEVLKVDKTLAMGANDYVL